MFFLAILSTRKYSLTNPIIKSICAEALITSNPLICYGKPCIRSMRWPIEVLLDMLGSGMSIEEILADHPEWDRKDFHALFHYAKATIVS